jgi:hypothetical protein
MGFYSSCINLASDAIADAANEVYALEDEYRRDQEANDIMYGRIAALKEIGEYE